MYKINQTTHVNIISIGIFCLIMAILNGCMQSNAATTNDTQSSSASTKTVITDNTLKIVNAAFYQTFVLGEWRYKGARDLGGTINAYIQIPAQLDMSKELQKSYLRKIICPSAAHKTMWNEVNDIPLSIHIYTHKQKHSLYVDCKNPLNA